MGSQLLKASFQGALVSSESETIQYLEQKRHLAWHQKHPNVPSPGTRQNIRTEMARGTVEDQGYKSLRKALTLGQAHPALQESYAQNSRLSVLEECGHFREATAVAVHEGGRPCSFARTNCGRTFCTSKSAHKSATTLQLPRWHDLDVRIGFAADGPARRSEKERHGGFVQPERQQRFLGRPLQKTVPLPENANRSCLKLALILGPEMGPDFKPLQHCTYYVAQNWVHFPNPKIGTPNPEHEPSLLLHFRLLHDGTGLQSPPL